MAVAGRFLIDLRLGPRTLETAKELVASVALCIGQTPALLLVDDYRPYPTAILQVFGLIKHGRRKNGRGRKKRPRLKPPPGLLVGVVQKLRDARGNLLGVKTRGLFGSRKTIRKRIAELGLGSEISIAYLERLNGTMRGVQKRLARRTRNVSRSLQRLQWSLWLWRDLYHWVRLHGSLKGRTPAMAVGLTDHRWSVEEYVGYPVHVDSLTRMIWAEDRENALTSALDHDKRQKTLPTS